MIVIIVLSLFDGMSNGQIALDKLGIKVDKYFASEIDKHSIFITKKNYPDTIHIGDVTKVHYENGILYTENGNFEVGHIDLFIGGSPCQNLSISVIDRSDHNQGLNGEKSKLFYEYLRLLRDIKPTYFLYENVASMKDKDKNIITEYFGVQPIMIDSNLVSAQDRKRYYWTNIQGIEQPKDKGIVLKDIIEPEVDDKYFYDKEFTYHGEYKKIEATLHVNCHDIGKRVYNKNGKCGTLTACRGGYRQKKIIDKGKVRKLTPLEYERLQTVPEGYTEGVAESHRYNMLGDGWTVDVIAHILSYMELEIENTYEAHKDLNISEDHTYTEDNINL